MKRSLSDEFVALAVGLPASDRLNLDVLAVLAREYEAATYERSRQDGGWVRGSCPATCFVEWLRDAAKRVRP